MFSKEGFGVAWGEYQKMLVEGVNELVGGMSFGCGSVLEVREVRRKMEERLTMQLVQSASRTMKRGNSKSKALVEN